MMGRHNKKKLVGFIMSRKAKGTEVSIAYIAILISGGQIFNYNYKKRRGRAMAHWARALEGGRRKAR
jgi:hypothetical protein